MEIKRINEIRSRCNAATMGPWVTSRPNGEYVRNPEINFEVCLTRRSDDAKFIAHARQDVSDLLDEAERTAQIIQQTIDYLTPAHDGSRATERALQLLLAFMEAHA